MPLFLKLLILLWFINFVPPFVAIHLEDKWNTPLDRGRLFFDKRPIFGSHKTIRGVLAGTVAGLLAGAVLGLGAWLGLCAGALGMSGDLFSSFIKRRFSISSGAVIPGLDQATEGLFPFLVLAPHFSLSPRYVAVVALVFGLGAYLGSIFLKDTLLSKPYEDYPRPVRARTRMREMRACEVTSVPLAHFLNFEDSVYYHLLVKSAIRMLGIYELGKRNALSIETRRVTFSFRGLPEAFDGYTILFISDLHLDGLDGLTEAIMDAVRDMPADLCVVGGDLRMETHGPFGPALTELLRILPEVRAKDGILGVLGNHDCIEVVQFLERNGMRYLVNDSLAVERGGERLWVVGVDDPHFFRCHDLELAFNGVPREEFSIFVAHSNEIYREAWPYGPKLYLCGHSHGGQIKFPLIGPIFTHSTAPRQFCEGAWSYNGMTGYTSAGAGVSGVPVRFATKGEITMITLRRRAERER